MPQGREPGYEADVVVFFKASEEVPMNCPQREDGVCRITLVDDIPMLNSVNVFFDLTSYSYGISVDGADFEGDETDIEFFIGSQLQDVLSVDLQNNVVRFNISGIESRDIAPYAALTFPVGFPGFHDEKMFVVPELTPKLVSVYPNEGTLAGTTITVVAAGVTKSD
jgi:hypothetical protein